MWTQTRRNTIILILVSDSNVLDVLRNISNLYELNFMMLLGYHKIWKLTVT